MSNDWPDRKEFWRNPTTQRGTGKRALVTGGAGFLGSYVVEILRRSLQ